MSRSFHVTRRKLETEMAADYAREEVRDERVTSLRRDLERKRSAKELVREERRARPPLVAVASDAVPIRLVDASEHIAYPASPEDLREVMRLLPPGTGAGLAAIELSLGRHEEEDYEEPDPFTGRRSEEFVPGAWRIGVLGTYSPNRAVIRLFGIVLDPECATRDLLLPYLRAKTLCTFIHELAHHQDHMTRVARGRWRADDQEHLETYAELRTHEWRRDVVLPYIQRQDPEGIARLLGWIQRHGGVAVTLPTLLGDPRGRMFPMQAFFPFHTAFEALVTDIVRGADPVEARLKFAEQVRWGEHYDEALEIVDGVLAERPGCHRALLERGEVCLARGQFGDAERLALAVAAEAPANTDVWQLLVSIRHATRDWRGMFEAASRAYELLRADDRDGAARCLGQRARARLAFRDFSGLDADLRELEEHGRYWAYQARRLRAVMLLETGHLGEALMLARERAAGDPYPELVAVAFEAARRMRRQPLHGVPSARMLERLREDGYEDWADRLTLLIA